MRQSNIPHPTILFVLGGAIMAYLASMTFIRRAESSSSAFMGKLIMKINSLLLLAAGALALVGCSTPTTVDKGPFRAHTFSFIAQGPKASAGNGDKFAPVHAMIQDAIITDLAQKGLGPVDAGGDVTIAYLLLPATTAPP